MHEELDVIPALQHRLSVHRRTIEYLEHQRAQFGAFTPAYIWHQFDDTRGEIAQIKAELRARGVVVDDQPGDIDSPTGGRPGAARPGDSRALLLTYQRMIVDQLRYLPLAGLSGWPDLSVRLDDLYVERTPIALGPGAGSRPRNERADLKASAESAATSLSGLLAGGRARILLEGLPGSGKTTSLHALALACAARATGDSAAAELVAGWPDPLPLPILLPAREIDAALSRGNAALEEQRLPTLSAFWSAIEEWLQYSNLQALVPTIQQLFEQGNCLVLIDALDDLPPSASQPAFLTSLGRFIARYPDNSYVVAGRNAHAGLLAPLPSFARFHLPDLDQPLADAMVARWYAIVADRAGLLMPEDITRRIAMLQGALHGDPRLKELARTPLTLVLCILAHAERYRLPDDRAVVLWRFADVMLNGWGHQRISGTHSSERQLTLLQPLALAFQLAAGTREDRPATLSSAEIEALLEQALASLEIGQAPVGEEARSGEPIGGAGLLGWCRRHGLLTQHGYDAYAMPQGQLREYLAGRALAAAPDFVTRAYALRAAPGWREPLLQALREIGQGSTPHTARLMVRLLLHPADSTPIPPGGDLLLAAECMGALGDRTRPDRALREEVRMQLIELMGSAGATVAVRIQAGLLLGRLGDTRFAGPLPPLVDVAAGRFLMGTPDGYDDEGPEQWVDLPDFAIGVYPVTNQEYAAFLADRPEYAVPRYWYDVRLNNPSGPVVGVTWLDAVAYCAWLTERLDRAGRLLSNQVVRLPLEAEWEKAASWDSQRQVKRRYPWGDEWSSERANTGDGRGAWLTAPVGCYPDGVSAYGLHDCIGNVWEWTASIYSSYPGAALAFHESGSYTLRGSSCASTPTHARCTYRSRLPTSYWRYHLGFRIVIGQPLDVPGTD
ncbi:MAG TPA: SUMF1/EgtB/PvdO family nonheme iron enzyme [Roseiflexaceae bacterium]|nr:SUMF1/EgtB/PvdO family nonheme iron enzyme [Roseiflexaceae bacterium]